MSTYNKTVWQDGDIITADKMNNIENGIYSYNEDITNLSGSVGDLKSALNDLESNEAFNLLIGASWELGSVSSSTGANSWSETRIRTGYIKIPESVNSIQVSCDSGWKYFAVVVNAEKTQGVISTDFKTTAYTIDISSLSADERKYIRFVLQRTNNTIELSDYTHAHMSANAQIIEDLSSVAKQSLYQFAPLIPNYNKYIDYDYSAGTITIPKDTVYIGYNADGNKVYKALNPSDEIVISNVTSASIGTSAVKLVLDTSTWTFSVVGYQTELSSTQKLVALIQLGSTAAMSSPMPWSVNGYPYRINIDPDEIERRRRYTYAVLLTGYNAYIDYDTTAKTITIPKDTIFVDYNADGTSHYKVLNNGAPVVISNVDSSGSSAIKLLLDVSTWTFSVVSYAATVGANKRLVAVVRLKSGSHVGSLSTPTPWSINGYPYGIVTLDKENVVMKSGTIKSINHRGYNTVAPENTLPAFRLSRLNGFEYVETDIQFTSDGVPVCLHDLSINRTAVNADGTSISQTINISDITYEQALNYVFCAGKYSSYPTVKIPTYAEFLNLCKSIGLKAYVELKSDVEYTSGQIASLVSMTKRNGMSNDVAWISSSTTLLGYVKTADANARLGVINAVAISASTVTSIEALRTGTNEVFLDIDNSVLTTDGIETCYTNDIPLEVWTINTDSDIQALDAYITGVTSDSKVASLVLYNANIE